MVLNEWNENFDKKRHLDKHLSLLCFMLSRAFSLSAVKWRFNKLLTFQEHFSRKSPILPDLFSLEHVNHIQRKREQQFKLLEKINKLKDLSVRQKLILFVWTFSGEELYFSRNEVNNMKCQTLKRSNFGQVKL